MAGRMRHGLTRVELKQVATQSVEYEVLECEDLNDHLPTVQSFQLSDVAGGTRATYRSEGTPSTIVGRAAAPLLTILTHRDAWASLDSLKQILEGQQSRT